MKVKKLIKKLSKLDGNLKVVLSLDEVEDGQYEAYAGRLLYVTDLSVSWEGEGVVELYGEITAST